MCQLCLYLCYVLCELFYSMVIPIAYYSYPLFMWFDNIHVIKVSILKVDNYPSNISFFTFSEINIKVLNSYLNYESSDKFN